MICVVKLLFMKFSQKLKLQKYWMVHNSINDNTMTMASKYGNIKTVCINKTKDDEIKDVCFDFFTSVNVEQSNGLDNAKLRARDIFYKTRFILVPLSMTRVMAYPIDGTYAVCYRYCNSMCKAQVGTCSSRHPPIQSTNNKLRSCYTSPPSSDNV